MNFIHNQNDCQSNMLKKTEMKMHFIPGVCFVVYK